MAYKGNISMDVEQETIESRLKHVIQKNLNGQMKATALEFVAYLGSHQMTPQPWFGPSYWRVPFGAYFVCGFAVNQDRWRLWFFSGEYSGVYDEGFVKAVHDSVQCCVACEKDCPQGKDMTIFGKEFKNACFQFPVQFENPTYTTLEYVKQLIEYWKNIAPTSSSWHAH